jgi:adenosine deaminase
VNENLIAIQEALALTEAEIVALARNSFIASFMTDAEKAAALSAFDAFRAKW